MRANSLPYFGYSKGATARKLTGGDLQSSLAFGRLHFLDPTSPGALPDPPFDKEFAGSPVMPHIPLAWRGLHFGTKLRRDIHARPQSGRRGSASDAFISRVGGPRGSRRLLRLRELIVEFAVAHRSDQNVND